MTNHSSLDVPALVAAALSAALDGHNPNRKVLKDGSMVLGTGGGPSDLDLTLDEFNQVRVAPRWIYREFALQAVHLVRWIAVRHGIPSEDLSETFRRHSLGHAAGRAAREGGDTGA